MRVLKFGGTSVGSAHAIMKLREIVVGHDKPVIVVVSAMSGITDTLIRTAGIAVQADAAYEAQWLAMKTRHNDTINEVVKNPEATCTKINALFDELSELFRGVYLVKDLSTKTMDTIVSYGERMSSIIVHAALEGSRYRYAPDFIKTETRFSRTIVDTELTNRLIKEHFADTAAQVTVVPGFISGSKSGEISNLGRGGSDYTAALLAGALNAEELEIWTDVDGFMSADPKVIKQAYVIEKLSYMDAIELSNFGAKIIYPPTIYPVFRKDIPVRIKNTFNPSAPGSLITTSKIVGDRQIIKGISSINDTALITVQGLGMVGVIGVNYRIFKALAKGNISVFMVAQASSESTTTLAVRTADADSAVEALKQEFEHDIAQGEISNISAEKDMATIAVVGENMKGQHGIAGKLFNTLGSNGINVVACAEGAVGRNISFVVDHKNLNKALNSIHDAFFLSEYKILNLFLVGVGTVGGSLLKQIRQQQEKLLKQNALKINIVGISNSKRVIFNEDGIALENYAELLKSGIETTPSVIKKHIINMNLPNSVFVDCTADAGVATVYRDLLDHNVSVVTANKIAASSDYQDYLDLKSSAKKQGVKFLFETNVGAGLPIINTINALTNSGDRISKIEAVLSGTLNFIFNTISDEIPFSKTVKMAQEAGYAEPDPRIDLSGVDVIRKLVILARESGYALDQNQVTANLIVPENCFEGTVDDFFVKIEELDADFEKRRKVLESHGKKWRFCAKLENGKGEVGLIEVDSRHPFYDLEGSNNIILITTDRYNSYPMMIKGYGAGAEVTAAGVFSDIISIANVR